MDGSQRQSMHVCSSGTLSYNDIAKDHPELVSKCEDLLEAWWRQIEQYLEQNLGGQQKETGSGDLGPRTELDFWRNQLQKITFRVYASSGHLCRGQQNCFPVFAYTSIRFSSIQMGGAQL
eukprot:TRINITY_DN2738_c0_g2_i4.p1 TRINITY_DN2738_c0_g2~~TRINITY_DN2738_c0_g2_i4.p1  ORF type:complete len:120 (+),score=21.69 TRINITY_DN2738_c0_g2_i4:187-546(+)